MYNLRLLRKLARSKTWQNLYVNSKEISSVHLFENSNDLTQLQLDFLRWLAIYHHLETELNSNSSPYLSREVIEDDIRAEAYLLFSSRIDRIDKDKKAKKKVEPSSGSVLFKRK